MSQFSRDGGGGGEKAGNMGKLDNRGPTILNSKNKCAISLHRKLTCGNKLS